MVDERNAIDTPAVVPAEHHVNALPIQFPFKLQPGAGCPHGIEVVFRRNDSGRIYGVTFIDHDSRVVLNGSRLGKEYSANVFNDLYSDERKTGIRQEQSTHQEQPDFASKETLVSGVASVVGAFGGLFGGASGGDEPQETASQKRKKKKKKRTRRID